MQLIQSMDELRQLVQETLCLRHSLDPSQFAMNEFLLRRRGRPCGVYFCQHGPRLMTAHAIWDADWHVLAFYDASGARFQKIVLSGGPAGREYGVERAETVAVTKATSTATLC